MLKIENLQKSFIVEKGKVGAVQNVSIDIGEGQFFTFLGPSGSGKSTTLRCIAGLEQPEGGEIHIGGECVFSAERRILVPPEDRPIGMVFQSYAIWPHMDVFHNVAFPLLYGTRGKKHSKAAIATSVRDALKTVQMEAYETRPATQLSGGQQQQLAIARALVTRPALLLLDEPTEGIQPSIILEIEGVIQRLKAAGNVSIFLVEQYLDFASRLADYIYVMEKGTIVLQGKLDALHEADVKRYLAF